MRNKNSKSTNGALSISMVICLFFNLWMGQGLVAQTNRFMQHARRIKMSFDENWSFHKGDIDLKLASDTTIQPDKWQNINLPHDWSIYGPFSPENPATNLGGALPGGIGWYRKIFTYKPLQNNQQLSLLFDGIYKNSELWLNGHYLGARPNGYIFQKYGITPFLKKQGDANILLIKVDNSAQPNSRWYSGSGINRHVYLIQTSSLHLDPYNLFIHTIRQSKSISKVQIDMGILNDNHLSGNIKIQVQLLDSQGKSVSQKNSFAFLNGVTTSISISLPIIHPNYWSPSNPYLYKAKISIYKEGEIIDEYTNRFGIRYFRFDARQGFFLNGLSLKIKGVCLHSDYGALGTAVNTSAIARQLNLLKQMGCNAIRTAHNPSPPEFLDLCDQMGFLVMDEAFDQWQKKKTKYDYSLDFKKWHKVDLQDQIKRDRNHPSVFMWSIGNEIREQFDTSGIRIARELTNIIRALDTTRVIVSALTEMDPDKNFIAKSGALDVLGFNYKQTEYAQLPKRFMNQKFIASETTSALETRGYYSDPSDTMRYWPKDGKHKYVENGHKDWTVSAYDNVAAYWGCSHEAAWLAVKNAPFMSGIFVWAGFDYLGEPTPYPFPARSAYFGIIDLAGLPKDVYYMYQSEWTDKPVLHIFPAWSGDPGQLKDVWVYYSQADAVELFLNGKSLGTKRKTADTLHVSWKIPFTSGELKAISRKNGKVVLIRTLQTPGAAAKLQLSSESKSIKADGQSLSYITVTLSDSKGNLLTDANNLLQFSLEGPARFIAADNGYQADTSSFQSLSHHMWKGKCIVIIQSEKGKKGQIFLHVSSVGLPLSTYQLNSN